MAALPNRHPLSHGFVVLDGGLATACEAKGEDLSDSLWSARLLLDAPEVLQAVHSDFIQAGARIVVTASYQACVQLLLPKARSVEAASKLIESSACIARAAASASTPSVLVAGSVGSYGACLAGGQEYSGQYLLPSTESTSKGTEDTALPAHVSPEWLSAWHLPRLEALQRGGCDLLACETLPCVGEIAAIAAALDCMDGGAALPVWVSMTLRDETHCASGEPIGDAAAAAVRSFGRRLLAFGVNCCAPHLVQGALAEIKHALKKCDPDVCIAQYPSGAAALQGFTAAAAAVREGDTDGRHTVHLLAYPNAGEHWNSCSRTWETVAGGPHGTPSEAGWGALHGAWLAEGATLLGGCCRCGPDSIKRISALLEA